MRMIDLIRHYDRRVSAQRALSPSLASKIGQLMVVFGSLPDSANAELIEKTALRQWEGRGTRRRMLAQLHAVLAMAADDALIGRAPKLQMPFVYDTRDVPISREESDTLLDSLRWSEPRWYPLALVLTHTGARLSEALRIDPAIDFSPRGTVLRKPVERRTKTVARTVPYSARMKAELAPGGRLCGLHHAGSVGPVSAGGLAPKSNSASAMLGSIVRETCRSLGLPEIRVNDLRHVFAGIVAASGGDIADIASMLGHSNLSMSLRYRGLVRGRAERIMESVG